MKTKKFFYGILTAAFALSLAGADVASAQYGGCGRGQRGGGRGVCVQNDQTQTTYQNQGRGRRGGQGRQQRLRDGSCVNNPATQSSNSITVPTPSN